MSVSTLISCVQEARTLVQESVFKHDSRLRQLLAAMHDTQVSIETLKKSQAGVFLNKELRPLLRDGSPLHVACLALLQLRLHYFGLARRPCANALNIPVSESMTYCA
jgi:hypothetical protein